VGIIERGRLLATGSVDEIQHRHLLDGEVPMAVMRVRLLHDATAAAAWLAERPDVTDVLADGSLAAFRFPIDRAAQHALLRDMLEAGLEVVEFGVRSTSLEDVFLKVTRGEVQ
jgi:ABC-2 type transport system ATP-binding protein